MHVEEGAGEVFDFPGGDEEKECEGCECGGAGAEDNVACLVVAFVAP